MPMVKEVPLPTTSAEVFVVDRRRDGRIDYSNPHLIDLLRRPEFTSSLKPAVPDFTPVYIQERASTRHEAADTPPKEAAFTPEPYTAEEYTHDDNANETYEHVAYMHETEAHEPEPYTPQPATWASRMSKWTIPESVMPESAIPLVIVASLSFWIGIAAVLWRPF